MMSWTMDMPFQAYICLASTTRSVADLGFEFRGGKHCAARQVGENFKRPVLGTKKKRATPIFLLGFRELFFFYFLHFCQSGQARAAQKKIAATLTPGDSQRIAHRRYGRSVLYLPHHLGKTSSERSARAGSQGLLYPETDKGRSSRFMCKCPRPKATSAYLRYYTQSGLPRS